MASLPSTKYKSSNQSPRNTQKYSGTSDAHNAFPVQTPTKKDTQDLNPHAAVKVRRKWPTWPDLDSLAQKAADVNNPIPQSPRAYLAPMERWRMETQQQSPWNSIAAVNASNARRPSDLGESPRDGSQGGNTDNGTWWP